MASWVIPNEGKILLLQRALQTTGASVEDYTLRGYSNNYTPVDGTTAANFTESAFGGYSAVSITHASFAAPTISSNQGTSTSSTPGTFSCTSGAAENMYGCWLQGVTSGKVIAAVRFDNVRSMAPGATETVTVTINDQTLH